VRRGIASGSLTAVHDVSDGGLLVALAEMALAGNCGVALRDEVIENASNLFGEGQGRFIVATRTDGSDYQDRWLSELLPLGRATGDCIRCRSMSLRLADLRAAYEGFFPRLMGSALTPEF
jgi:phosphoribosylformylglycinamidine synthase